MWYVACCVCVDVWCGLVSVGVGRGWLWLCVWYVAVVGGGLLSLFVWCRPVYDGV